MAKRYLLSLSILITIVFTTQVLAQGTIGIIVNKDLYSSVKAAVDGYAADVEKIEKKTVWLDATTFGENGTVQDLKAALTSQYNENGLEGAVLIGDLPVPEYSSSGFYGERDQYVCDLYYMDLDGSWSGSGSVFSNHSGNKEAEIWISRLTGSVLESYFGDEVTLVNDYFARVQKRMYGQDDMERLYVIAGQKSEWGGLEAENQGDMGYEKDNIDTYTGSCGSQWSAALVEGREYGFVYSHSSPTMHAIGFNMNNQRDVDMDCRFYNSYACSNADYDRANMCGGYALEDAGLICVGSAKTGSMKPGTFRAYNKPLGAGDCFGEAFRKWFNEEGIFDVYWHYGMNLQGAGSLVLAKYASGPYLTVNSPNGGEEWEQGNTYTIKWGSNVSGNVKIELLKGGAVDKTLAADVANNGVFDVEVTMDFTVGADYKIKISSLDNDTVLSESAENFSIIAEYIIADFPHIQDFDDMETDARPLSEKWEQLAGDDFDWLVFTGPTPSNQYESTGPTADKTSGTGNYIYVEASSPNNPQKKTEMISPKFNLNLLNKPELIFWAHMQSDSNAMGNLYVDIEVDGVMKEGVVHLKDDHGKEWFEVKQDLSQYKGERVRFILRGITGSSWCGDMAVDDFQVAGESVGIKGLVKLPKNYSLRHNGSRVIFQIPEYADRKQVSVKLFNVQGKLVRTLVKGPVSAGSHSVGITMKRNALAAGLYLCRMEVGSFTKTITILVRK